MAIVDGRRLRPLYDAALGSDRPDTSNYIDDIHNPVIRNLKASGPLPPFAGYHTWQAFAPAMCGTVD